MTNRAALRPEEKEQFPDAYNRKKLVQRWEDQRNIKNLMGKYCNIVILNRRGEIPERFWSAREDISLPVLMRGSRADGGERLLCGGQTA